MKTAKALSAFATAAVLAAVFATSPTTFAQRGRGAAPTAPAGPAPRMANGKPDLSGHWANPYTPNMAMRVVDPATRQPLTFARQGEALKDAVDPKRTFDLPYTDWGLKKWKEYDPVGKGDYTGNCLPFGMSRNINSPHGTQILQSPDAVAFLFEQNTWFNVVYMDGRPHPKDLEPTWFGHSIGKWDGDTLVVDTVGFNGKTRLDTLGHPHSDQLHVIQRLTLKDTDHMNYEVTIDDPKFYTRPWTNTRTYWRMPHGQELIEYSCEENNRDLTEGHLK